MSEHWREEDFLTYLDVRAGGEERRRLEKHLVGCSDCRTRLEELRSLMGALGEWKAVSLSPGFDARLRGKLEQERSRGAGWLAFVRPGYAAALAVAAVMAIGLSLWQPAAPEPVKPQASNPAAVGSVSPQALTAEGEDLAVVDNPVLLEDFDLLENFDGLFEPLPKEGKRKL